MPMLSIAWRDSAIIPLLPHKNAMVSGLYPRLGFKLVGAEGKTKLYTYDIQEFTPYNDIPIEVVEEREHANQK